MRLTGLMIAAAMLVAPAVAQTGAAERGEVVRALADALEKDYVYRETGKQYAEMLRGKAASTAYAEGDDFAFAQAVTADLNAVKADKHLRLLAPLPPEGAGGQRVRVGGGPAPGMKAVEATERLAPEIAYIRFGVFPGDAATLADVEAFLAANAGVTSLIVDVRGNRGGGLREMDLMFADLFAAPVDLVQMETSEQASAILSQGGLGDASLRELPAAEGRVLQQHFVTPSKTPRLKDTKLYVLQSGFSGSAAEHFLLAVKVSKRGKLVGETSAGAGHFGFPEDLPHGFSTFVPTGRTFDPATGWDWEAKGVPADVNVPAADALVWALKDAGVAEAEAKALDAKVAFVQPKRSTGGGQVAVRVPAPG